ncbi:ABC transporter permease [Roseibium aggregatum]|uniref:ABC transporter permease n=1 Tax=Roseibium aggregatum TaxID=187304 RepID=A0A939J3G5_9HYPH|nr:ABC transporter permease [Roseibium aggregatum]MBN9669644.1 ABC transporter permease [Roseibium aggregatum]
MLDGTLLIRRQAVPGWLGASCYAGGLCFGLGLSAILLVSMGISLENLYQEFVVQTFLTSQGLGQTVTATVPLILVGLGMSLAMRVRFWNIGIEGQLWCGAMAATWISIHDVGPEPLRLLLMMLAAMAAGAAWIGIGLALKLFWSVSEVISTLLLGSIAFFWVQHMLFGAWRDTVTGFATSPSFDPAERLVLLGWEQVHSGIWIALAAVVVCTWLTGVSRFGLLAKAIGANPRAARATGLPVIAAVSLFVLGSGALCGLAGAVIAAGTEYRLSQSIGAGYLFSGIVIAFLARANPLAVLAVAFVLGGITTAGGVLKVFYGISEAVVLLVQGLVLLSVLAAQLFADYRLTERKSG